LDHFILTPPVAFLIILGVTILVSEMLSKLSFKRKDKAGAIGEPYACGEDVYSPLVQPTYGQFFPFAFFFTILHVVALIITTVPVETLQTFSIAVVYIVGAMTGLYILFRRD
jgi:NADH:ubiquinone oxidoreductase subunit 3 (subunit A)